MRSDSPVPQSPVPTRLRKPYAPPQISQMSPLQAEFVLQKLDQAKPDCARRLRRAAQYRDEAPARWSARQWLLGAVALANFAGLLLVPMLIVADYAGVLRLHHAQLDTAGAVVICWLVCCIALALGPGWLLDALPEILDRPWGPRVLMLLIAINLIGGFAILYRWSKLPPWAP